MKKYFLLCVLLFSFTALFSQSMYDSLLNELDEKYPQEKTYVQTDKAFYNAGETIWFKAYVRPDHAGTQISTTLYAELINEQGSILERKTMPILLSGAASHFVIPDTLKVAKLYIRAYTAWMLNFDSNLFYSKAINIIAPETLKKVISAPKFTLTFFAEGGDLVEGIESRLAFKANDQDGKPFNVKGNILNTAGKEVAVFNSVHNGMGYVNLTPAAGQLKASWKDPQGKIQETLLPAVKASGATLSVQLENELLKFTVKRSANAGEEMKEFVVLAQMQQQTVYAARINLKNKMMASAPIPLDSLPDGVMQITLFNAASKPVAERIIFNKSNTQYFIADLHLVEKKLTSKGKNVLQVDVGGSLRSNLSIAVTDADIDVPLASQENIYSSFLLSSDIKGRVYNPAYYFSSDADSVNRQLDLVMMTNGWRRFNWDQLIAGQMPVIKHAPENFLSIRGNVFGLTPMQLNDKMITGVIHSGTKGESTLFTVPIAKDGSFLIDQLYFFDTVKVAYQINADKNKRLTDMASFSFKNNFAAAVAPSKNIVADLSYSPQPATNIALKSSQLKALSDDLNRQKIKTLETVSVASRVKDANEKLNETYTSGMFSSGNAKIINTEDDPSANSAMTVLDYLRGRVAGLQINTGGAGEGSITRRGSATEVFLNEMRTDISLIQSTPMSEVAMIKVFDPPFFGSFGGGAGGAVAVYTKKGGGTRNDVKGLSSAQVQGYSSIKEFYSPDYSTEPGTPDYRTTLYWNPFLLLNPQNKRITIPFYNSDATKRIRVIIEGINELGQLTREEKIFE